MRGVSFAQRFRAMAAKRSSLCIGLDPSEDLLRLWNLPVSADGARQCCAQLMDAAHSHAAVVKPQSAFFEQFGVEGMAALRDVVAYARAQGFLVLLDCKRGDIGSTADAYARAYLEHGGDFEVDAITVQAYLGTGMLEPFAAAASRTGKAIFVVVLSSNPEGAAIQHAELRDSGRTVARELSDWIAARNRDVLDAMGIGPVGAVVGATLGEPAREILSELQSSLILAPGIGAQGATFDEFGRWFVSAAARTMPAVSRGLAAAGPNPAALRLAAAARLYARVV